MSESVIADITLEPEPSCIRKALAWETIPPTWHQFISNPSGIEKLWKPRDIETSESSSYSYFMTSTLGPATKTIPITEDIQFRDINSFLAQEHQQISNIRAAMVGWQCPQTWAKNDLWAHELLCLALQFIEAKKLLTSDWYSQTHHVGPSNQLELAGH